MWSGGTSPEPESNWLSTLADVPNTDNITGFKNARADELCKQYAQQFDITKRFPLIRELDGIVTNAYQYALLWTAPYTRVVYWNKFGASSRLYNPYGRLLFDLLDVVDRSS